MANLLPFEYKKKNRTEYILRLVVVVMCAAIFLILSSLALLIPSYVRALSQESTAEARLARVESGAKKATALVPGEQDPSARLAKLDEKAELFLRAKKASGISSIPTEGIQEVIELKPASLKISSITYDKAAGREKFIVSGIALHRDDLARFVEDLKKNTSFTKVELPISSYVKSTNISFSIVLERAMATSGKETS